MDYESVAALCEAFNEYFRTLVEAIREVSEKIGEILEEIRDTILKAENKPKYKFIKSLIKPYKQPFIKVRYRAISNL